jgi:hypothetical protein
MLGGATRIEAHDSGATILNADGRSARYRNHPERQTREKWPTSFAAISPTSSAAQSARSDRRAGNRAAMNATMLPRVRHFAQLINFPRVSACAGRTPVVYPLSGDNVGVSSTI